VGFAVGSLTQVAYVPLTYVPLLSYARDFSPPIAMIIVYRFPFRPLPTGLLWRGFPGRLDRLDRLEPSPATRANPATSRPQTLDFLTSDLIPFTLRQAARKGSRPAESPAYFTFFRETFRSRRKKACGLCLCDVWPWRITCVRRG